VPEPAIWRVTVPLIAPECVRTCACLPGKAKPLHELQGGSRVRLRPCQSHA
jgi:hypothetical protein